MDGVFQVRPSPEVVWKEEGGTGYWYRPFIIIRSDGTVGNRGPVGLSIFPHFDSSSVQRRCPSPVWPIVQRSGPGKWSGEVRRVMDDETVPVS